MTNKVALALAALFMLLGTAVTSGTAHAQAWSEANSPGFRGGYGTFGGYYDTFGEYGGHHSYNGYVRTEGRYSQTVTLLTVPLQRVTPGKVHHAKAHKGHKAHHVKVVHVADDCGWLRRRAHDTGARKWKNRYDACRRQV